MVSLARLAMTPLLGIMLLQGCTSIGPSSVLADRSSFGESSNESAKQELLLNLVRLRYGDTPSVVRINQLVAGYTLEGQLNLGSSLFSSGFSFHADDAVSGGVTYSDRPTITYAPIRGADYGAFLMTPLAPSEVLALIMSGAPGDVVITLGVQAINGLRNRFDSGLGRPQSDLGFRSAMYLIEQLGLAGKMGVRFENQGENRSAYLVFYDKEKDMDPAEVRLRRILKLDPARREFKVVFGLTPNRPDEIAFYTRSLMQTMSMIAASIEVPESDIDEGRTRPTEAPDPSDQALPALHITSQRLPPVNAFTSVRYRERYFAIDDRDLVSKRMFSMLQLLATISDRGRNETSPIITIPSS